MKIKYLQIALLSIFVVFNNANGQRVEFTIDKREKVLIQSWQKGTETVENQQIKLALSSKNKIYNQEIIGDSGKRYLLRVIHSPYSNLNLEHWEVKMFEILSKASKPKLSESLFSPEKYGTYLQDAYIGVLYPEEKPIVYSEKNEALWGEGKGFYYFKTVRIINIESFCVVIRVGNYKFNKNKTKLDLFEVLIDFTPTCKG